MRSLRYLLPYLAHYRWRLTLGLVCVLGMSVVGLFSPLVVGQAVDSLGDGVAKRELATYAGWILAIATVQGLFSFGQRRILVAMSRQVEFDLRNRYLESLERQSQSFFQEQTTGDLMARATNDLEAVRMVCGPAVMYSANTLFTGVGAILLMASIHGWLTLVVISTLPLVAIVSREFGQRIHGHFSLVQEQFARLSTRAQESFAGARVVRAYAREPFEEEAFRDLNRVYVERNRRLILWSSAFRPLLQTLIGFGFVGVLGAGGLLTYLGEMTVGDFVKFNLFLGKLAWPMIAIGWVINLLQRGSASLARIQEVLDTEPAIRDADDTSWVEGLRGDLEMRHLDFSYGDSSGDSSALTLADIHLTLPAGTTVAVVGRTGSGKSTLLSLIPRLVDPPAGSLFLDGHDVRALPLAQLRGLIGMVPQETFLFSATVRENISLGRPDASPEELLGAALVAGLDRDLEILPQGLDTVVGERGVTLSGGQKQRVALARALVREPTILLLDDCLSAVDTETEERILGNLRGSFAGRTVLLVSHRISTVKNADLILVLEGGRIAQQGRHEDLVKTPGLYRDLHQRQQLEEQLAAV